MFWVLKNTCGSRRFSMRHVKYALLLVGVLAALAPASFGGTFEAGPVTGDGTSSADDSGSVGGPALARIAGLHW
jgi:hypothetical protein